MRLFAVAFFVGRLEYPALAHFLDAGNGQWKQILPVAAGDASGNVVTHGLPPF